MRTLFARGELTISIGVGVLIHHPGAEGVEFDNLVSSIIQRQVGVGILSYLPVGIHQESMHITHPGYVFILGVEDGLIGGAFTRARGRENRGGGARGGPLQNGQEGPVQIPF